MKEIFELIISNYIHIFKLVYRALSVSTQLQKVQLLTARGLGTNCIWIPSCDLSTKRQECDAFQSEL